MGGDHNLHRLTNRWLPSNDCTRCPLSRFVDRFVARVTDLKVGGPADLLFQPLFYQVATEILSEGEITPPTREILRGQANLRVLRAEVTDLDQTRR
jgi:hypothetical protein